MTINFWDGFVSTGAAILAKTAWEPHLTIKHAQHDLNDALAALEAAEANVFAWGAVTLAPTLVGDLERAELVVSLAATRLGQARRRAPGTE